MNSELCAALKEGIPAKVSALIEAGVDICFRDENGYDALIYASCGRDIGADTELLDLLKLLIEKGVSPTGTSSYGESAVKLCSRKARFDAVKLLLDAGANPADLEWTPLMEAVAFGQLADVEAALSDGPELEAKERWRRTAWLMAVQMGDIPKAELLLLHGAQKEAVGNAEAPALFYGIASRNPAMVNWLIELGCDVSKTDKHGHTALAEAAGSGDLAMVESLLIAGADVEQTLGFHGALSVASSAAIAKRLLAAGVDPQDLSRESRRSILGLPALPDESLLRASRKDFERYRSPRFGAQNPEVMNNPFWEGMVRAGINAWMAAETFKNEGNWKEGHPIWCADRFGQSLTFLPDGRIVQIGGEHEDYYDPDFCIYNDVFVHEPAGKVTIYGYPEEIFPPTDFHTATLIGEAIYLVGSVSYNVIYGETPVYRLDLKTFKMERVEAMGRKPGWISRHRADLIDGSRIRVTGGKIFQQTGEGNEYLDNGETFILDVSRRVWL